MSESSSFDVKSHVRHILGTIKAVVCFTGLTKRFVICVLNLF